MSTTLPVPIEFRLPDGWRPAPPDEVGAPDVAFVALYPKPDGHFTANITIDGDYRPDDSPLADIADESVERMRSIADSVVLTGRQEVGSEDAPALTQQLSFTAVLRGERTALLQTQVYLSMLDENDPHQRAVIRLALTATAGQHDDVLGDFQEFVRSVGPDTGAE
ncbi:hypothetical protein [Actinacidiphila bryophytorum]|uniref:hypothetical protein n=1 Tax=Actinacidiphila bryophytorum TaxID=1436133 RepID=UPI0021769C4E|nr:hypothetical protein [Actinacidiphila bryophytorum]UWE12665.1 hypothetical protein NYE86_30945 [Actinacidiphila bryophytorum]